MKMVARHARSRRAELGGRKKGNEILRDGRSGHGVIKTRGMLS